MNNTPHEDAQHHDCHRPADPPTGTALAQSDPTSGEPPPAEASIGCSDGTYCPVCWQANAGCRLKGEFVACPHRRYGDALDTIERDGCVYHLYRIPDGPLPQCMVALFEPNDLIVQRQIESWEVNVATGGREKRDRVVGFATSYRRAETIARSATLWRLDAEVAADQGANQYFGVCPRFASPNYGKTWDHAFQIRMVRCVWADIDHCAVDEALARCAAAGLPRPTVTVGSGHGAHLYWRLDQAYPIDDAGEPPALRWEDVVDADGQVVRYDGKPKRQAYYLDAETGAKVSGRFPLSEKAEHLKRLVSGIATLVGGDHTKDSPRLLRLPGSVNRKGLRNGRRPVPCVVVECDPSRRHPLSVFEALVTPVVATADRSGPRGSATVSKQALHATKSGEAVSAADAPPVCMTDPDDSSLIARAHRAANGQRFSALFDAGDVSAHKGDHSRADYALCDLLAFWTGPDAARIDRLFRASRLYRQEKWSRPEYSEGTIGKVLERRTIFWGQWPDDLPQIPLADLMDWDV